ncbi:MAG: DUF4136 domain-containing protein [Bacteroidetes bacterium]|nr:DUF4136 domain-containing protein [Bacteroidota bacterium]
MTAINKINRILIISGIFLMAVITGCSTVLVQSDYDREINFANFHTFDWRAQSENAGSNAVQRNTLFERRLKKAVDKELTANGFQKQTAERPDFLIAYSIQVKDQVNVLSSGYGYGGYGYGGFGHGYGHHGFRYRFGHQGYGRHRFAYRSGYYGGGGLVEVTLVLDFVDPESNNVIWRGLYKDEIGESGIMIMTVDKITKAVKKILKEFPPGQMTITDRSFSNTEGEFVSLTTLKQNR